VSGLKVVESLTHVSFRGEDEGGESVVGEFNLEERRAKVSALWEKRAKEGGREKEEEEGKRREEGKKKRELTSSNSHTSSNLLSTSPSESRA